MGQKKRIQTIDGHTPMTLMLDQLERLEGHVSSDHIKEVKWFIRECKFQSLQSRADFQRAYAAGARAQQYYVPVSASYGEALVGMLRWLQAADKSHQDRLKLWHEEDVQRVWGEVCEILKEHLDTEVWKRVGSQMEGLFAGKPPKSSK